MTNFTRRDDLGVLALQGDYVEHQRMLERLGCPSRLVRKASDLDGIGALILPGGESTTMIKFILEEDLLDPLKQLFHRGTAFYGTCAGAILLAKEVMSPTQLSLGVLDIAVERNGYGRQVDSHESSEPCSELGKAPLPMVFIRAPVITRTGPSVRVLAEHRHNPVLVREERVLVSTFHPELSEDTRVHEYFLERVARRETDPITWTRRR